MRVSSVLAAVVAMSVSVFVVIQLLGSGRPKVEVNPIKVDRTMSGTLTINKDGPQPKVVVEADYDFGRMEVGEQRSHDYVFRNEGDAPLFIEMERTTCQCTVATMKMGETREIAPGKSFDLKLTWKPEVLAEKFNKGADFFTNDPKRLKVNLRILGMVAPRMAIRPEKDWVLSGISDDKPGVFTGTLMSPIADQFQIVAIENRSDLLSFEVTPLTKEKMEIYQGKCGYEVKVTVKPEMPLGAFLFPITIKTDLPERSEAGQIGKPMEFEILVSGIHRGPIQPAGREWVDDKMAISMGSFEATVGKKVRLPLFVKSIPEEGLQLTAAPICTPAELKVDIEREDRANGKPPRFFLNLEYPAGSPRAKHREEDPGKIRLQTNHPHGQNVEFLVFFSAY